jgi:uncharacterized alpha-E superfamily protein
MSTTEAPIMVRARITSDEWLALRKLALERNTAPADLIADALRATYNLTPEGTPDAR